MCFAVVSVHSGSSEEGERPSYPGGAAEDRQWPCCVCRGHSTQEHGLRREEQRADWYVVECGCQCCKTNVVVQGYRESGRVCLFLCSNTPDWTHMYVITRVSGYDRSLFNPFSSYNCVKVFVFLRLYTTQSLQFNSLISYALRILIFMFLSVCVCIVSNVGYLINPASNIGYLINVCWYERWHVIVWNVPRYNNRQLLTMQWFV